jgi:hypothetical protein
VDVKKISEGMVISDKQITCCETKSLKEMIRCIAAHNQLVDITTSEQ